MDDRSCEVEPCGAESAKLLVLAPLGDVPVVVSIPVWLPNVEEPLDETSEEPTHGFQPRVTPHSSENGLIRRECAVHVSPREITGALAMFLMAAWWTGCTAGSKEASTPGSPTPRSASSATESLRTHAGAPSSASAGLDALKASPAARPYGVGGGPAAVIRASDGTTIVQFPATWPGERTSYRLYDRRWRPLTPLLRVDASLGVQRATATGFVGRASKTNRDGSYKFNEWVTIDRVGRLHQIAHQPDVATPAKPPRPGDIFLEGEDGGHFGYRPATDTILKQPRPPWNNPAHSWYVDSGLICAMRSSRVSAGLVHMSIDEGRTFTDLSASDAIPAGSGPRLQACHATKQGVILVTGGEYLDWLHTLDRAGHLISSQRLGTQLDPYNWDTLPDGRLVTGTNRPGLMVATDATNRTMEYRPGPNPMNSGFEIVGGQIFFLTSHNVYFSEDAGLTWQRFDLQLP